MAKNIGLTSTKMVTLMSILSSVLISAETSSQSIWSGVHHYMSKRELSRYFGTEKHDEVPDYEVVHPRKVDKSGKFIEHKLSQDEDEAHRAENHGQKDLHYNIKAFGDNFNLHLKKNQKLFAKDLEVEVLGQKGKILRKEKVRNCYYHGHSKNHPKSRATMSSCDNLAGAIHVGDASYFIEPLPRHIADRYKRSEPKTVPHIMYRSGSSQMTRRERSPMTEKRTTFCGTEDDPTIRLPREVNSEQDSNDYGDSKDTERYIETLVVVDEKMCAFHGEDAAKQFTLAACNIASGLLKDSSIGSNPINLVITKMQIHTTPQEGLLINNHAMNSLSNFGKWAERNTVPDDTDPQHYDYATLFTRYNICKDKNQPCDTLGVTNVGGMCQFPKSVSICEDNGLMIGKTLAHETGHSLGMNHDLSPFCDDSKKMMSLHAEGSDAYEWSKCSRMFLKQFLDSSNAQCLEDRPMTKQIINVQIFNDPGLLYNANQQCALSYGDGAKYCKDKSPEEMCSQLWCLVPSEGNNCRNLNQPLADGTACGEQKWCKRGKCVEKYTEGPDAIDGGWSIWSKDYTECTRSCSGGVQYRTRQCSNPLPTNGGQFCEGEHREYRLCNTKKCEDETSFRHLQCEEKNKEMFNDKFFQWEWRPSNLINKCTLGCFIKNIDQGYAFGNVEDGTNCDEDSDNYKCVNGECMHIGCDNVIGSSAKHDRCGICNGDGSTCSYGNGTDEALKSKLTQKFKEQGRTFQKTLSLLQNMGYAVPEDYASTKMDEVISDFYWAAIKTGCSATCGGGMEVTKSECRLSDDGSPVADTNCDVKTKPSDRTTRCNTKPCRPEWRTDRWEDCSKTCNGGTRSRHVKCVQIVDGGIEYDVEDEMCDDDIKPKTKEECNKQECKPEWIAQPFGACSTSCGRGVQRRKITCEKVTKDGDTVDVENEKCSDLIKPNSEEYCNVHNPCPGEGECGGNYNQNKGYITSPGFPNNYSNGRECMHSIIMPNDKAVKLVFDSFDLSGGMNNDVNGACTGDFVKIIDGDCNSAGTETRYCGNRNAAPFLSSGNKLCVKFFSDESRTSKGFNASFEAVDHPARPKDPCGSTITATVGLLSSPNYPEPYPSNEMCNMTIKTLEGPIRLDFQYFDIGMDEDCNEDYLLLQGDSDASKLCGSNLPNQYNVNGSTLKLSFRSGQQNFNKMGFVATYISGKEMIEKSTENKPNTDIKPSKLSEINPDNDLTDSVRDTIPRPSNERENKHQNSVKFLPISSNSLDSKEVAKEEISGTSRSAAVTAKSTEKNIKPEKLVSASVTPKTGESSKKDKAETSTAKKDSRQSILRPLQSVLEQNGALMTRGQCPDPSRLSCLNLLYSYPCANNNACQLRGMDCCPTSCSYGPNMCVPKVWRECPLVTPYIAKVLHTCTTSTDCQPNHICCIDMLGRRYCHKHEMIDK